jgi:hypothetical protein
MRDWQCRVCGMNFPHHLQRPFLDHVQRCVDRNAEYVDAFRTPAPFEGDPEMAAFAAAEGDVYNRRPGTRRVPR